LCLSGHESAFGGESNRTSQELRVARPAHQDGAGVGQTVGTDKELDVSAVSWTEHRGCARQARISNEMRERKSVD
jgi:hypothetical protein